ncbi:site-specific DNA-methyltransferase [Corynebacterium appendicis]|uniref:site-specific DNA-methyltransferase n=1 Tax=Corynebacterium appendicis TaxID=163202 RepID=UPI0021AF21BC|nr:DNA methyltransferase [Corynebacterium appendicis]MCT1683814.1 site-specific DNA-methyltransferase [Corynebacterium appendicis]
MSRLTDLLQQARGLDPRLAAELEREIRHSQNKRSFGLVFERHLPDTVELPTRPVRRGDIVYVLQPRGSKKSRDKTLWTVAAIDRKAEGGPSAMLVETKPDKDTEPEVRDGVLVEDLVVVAQHDDTIYPGLVQTGEVINSDDPEAPFHTVINSENLHALNLLTYTHRHKVDCIYIDPPYNTGAKDWKYNNDYVDGEDAYRHSKWLSFMEKRLELAKELLNPEDSVLIVTIDEKEYLRLGMLLEQTFPDATIQMVSSVINPKGASRQGSFARVDEYLYFVRLGNSVASPQNLSDEWKISEDKRAKKIRWAELLRSGSNYLRSESENQFYPIFIRNGENGPEFVEVGEPFFGTDLNEVQAPADTSVVWPIRKNGDEGNWQISADNLRRKIQGGYAKLGRWRGGDTTIYYLKRGEEQKVISGFYTVVGRSSDNSVVVNTSDLTPMFIPGTQWRIDAHNAEQGGTAIVNALLPRRIFPYPKSLYAVEDALRFFVKDKPNATVLDFFSGSGTTAHAVMRLNKQDGGRRRSISVTNNEVGFKEAKKLTKEGFRPGDPEWEQWGICDYVTKPRIEAAITGKTPASDPIKGDYKFTDEFPMADGFEANARFFTLTYEPPTRVRHGLAFAEIAPLLWLRAGQFGRVMETIPARGWDVAESHGVVRNVAAIDTFAEAVHETGTVTTVYVVTDDALTFQSAVAKLADIDVEVVQLYSTYLTNFAFTQSGGGI